MRSILTHVQQTNNRANPIADRSSNHRRPEADSARAPAWATQLPDQTRLAVNQPGDLFEEEANRVANAMAGASDVVLLPRLRQRSPIVQRAPDDTQPAAQPAICAGKTLEETDRDVDWWATMVSALLEPDSAVPQLYLSLKRARTCFPSFTEARFLALVPPATLYSDAKRKQVAGGYPSSVRGDDRKLVWRESQKPFAGYTVSGYDASKRFATPGRLKQLGYEQTPSHVGYKETAANSSKAQKSFAEADVLVFSGHQYAQYKVPGLWTDDSFANTYDARTLQGPLNNVKLLISTSCATLCREPAAIWRSLFPKAAFLGYKKSAPLNGAAMASLFASKLPKDLLLEEGGGGVGQAVGAWKASIRSNHRGDTTRQAGWFDIGANRVEYWTGSTFKTVDAGSEENKCREKGDYSGDFPDPGAWQTPQPLPFPTVQPKLAVNQPGDRYEQEADRVATQVMRMPAPALQRCGAACGCPACRAAREGATDEAVLWRKTQPAGPTQLPAVPSAVDGVLRKSGRPLDAGAAAFMGARFGLDFSHVRVHTDATDGAAAQAIAARAFTVNNHLAFAPGEYQPHTRAGRQLLAHELAHVVQQGQGRAASVQRFTKDQCTASTCSPAESCDTVQADFERAEGYLDKAITAMSASPLTTKTTQAVRWFFHRDGDTSTQTILNGLNLIKTMLLMTDVFGDFRCDSGCSGNVLAYVRVKGTLKPGETDFAPINLCKSYFKSTLKDRAITLIHEASHLAGMSVSTDDVYEHTQRFRYLPADQALANADSYALFAAAIAAGIPADVAISFGIAGTRLATEDAAGWAGTLYADVTWSHPVLHIFNPELRLSLTFTGYPDVEPASGAYLKPSRDMIAGLLPGIRLQDPRPQGGAGFFTFHGGPTYNIGGTEPGGFGLEVGAAVGYHWRWLDVGAGVSYNYDPKAPEGFEHLVRVGPTLRFTAGIF